jgi:hypothetical protein
MNHSLLALKRCTVRVECLDGGFGTGIFVASRLILTCAHVVHSCWQAQRPVTISWTSKRFPARIANVLEPPYPDLALLEIAVEHFPEPHPCVLLEPEPRFSIRDKVSIFGVSDVEPGGGNTTLEVEDAPDLSSRDSHALVKLKGGNVRLGNSGAGVLHETSGRICALLQITRSPDQPMGGRAIPTSTIFKLFPYLEMHNRNCHTAHDSHSAFSQIAPPPRATAPDNPFATLDGYRIDQVNLIRNRRMVVAQVLHSVQEGQHCSIIGPSQSGKTVVLNSVRRTLVEKNAYPESSIAYLTTCITPNESRLRKAIVSVLGASRTEDVDALLEHRSPVVLILDDFSGMDKGPTGFRMRRLIRGWTQQYGVRLVVATHDRLDSVFHADHHRDDSPLHQLITREFSLGPLTSADCSEYVKSMVKDSSVQPELFVDLYKGNIQPGELRRKCEERFSLLIVGETTR